MIDEEWYNKLFEHFRAICFRVAPELARDSQWCRDILHARVLRIMHIESIDEMETRLRGLRREFAGVAAFKKYLNVLFKNAIIDELRHVQTRQERTVSLEELNQPSSDQVARRELPDLKAIPRAQPVSKPFTISIQIGSRK